MIWKDIPGFAGRYQVSDEGEVRSVDRPVRTKGGTYCIRKGRILKPQDTWDGYYTIGMYDDHGKYYIRTIHRIVAEVFIPNPNNYPVINHLDCNPHNNHVDNLEWTTVQGNTLHAVANGRFHIDPVKIRKASEAAAQKKRKPVQCIETGEIFPSITAVLKHVGLNTDIHRYISQSLPIKGHHYVFVKPEDQEFSSSHKDNYRRKPPTMHNSKKVRCIETGEVFSSQVEAERKLLLPLGYVSGSAKHRHTNSHGVSFEYV